MSLHPTTTLTLTAIVGKCWSTGHRNSPECSAAGIAAGGGAQRRDRRIPWVPGRVRVWTKPRLGENVLWQRRARHWHWRGHRPFGIRRHLHRRHNGHLSRHELPSIGVDESKWPSGAVGVRLRPIGPARRHRMQRLRRSVPPDLGKDRSRRVMSYSHAIARRGSRPPSSPRRRESAARSARPRCDLLEVNSPHEAERMPASEPQASRSGWRSAGACGERKPARTARATGSAAPSARAARREACCSRRAPRRSLHAS